MEEIWKLYWDLSDHTILSEEKIDLVDVKVELTRIMLFDIIVKDYTIIQQELQKLHTDTSSSITKRFGPAVSDVEGFNQARTELNKIPLVITEPLGSAKRGSFAEETIDLYRQSSKLFEDGFQTLNEEPKEVLLRLEEMKEIEGRGVIEITDNLISKAMPQQ